MIVDGALGMKRREYSLIAAISILVAFGENAEAQFPVHVPLDPDYAAVYAANDRFDFERRDEMIPMRDGARLYTIILIPRVKEAMPVLLTRTPYSALKRFPPEKGTLLESALPPGDEILAGANYIRVFQDVRGKFRSEGDYVITRPIRGPLNPTDVDHSTDTYDTIEWLLKNVPGNNGRVGMIGTSYEGFLVLMGLINPHPALKAAVAVNPMVDGWMGDDWFHKGAFRQEMMSFIYDQEASRDSTKTLKTERADDYDLFLNAVSAGELGRRNGMEQLSFWRNLSLHPAYDDYWQGQALDKILSSQNLKVPTMFVHSLWDQEDIYGAIAAYRAAEAQDVKNDRSFLVIGPWQHGGSSGYGGLLGPFTFDGEAAIYFRRDVLLPFLNERLKEGAAKANTPPVLAYETGTNSWRRYDAWPLSCESGCSRKLQPLYLNPGLQLSFAPPGQDGAVYAEYVSDPDQPVPYRVRPIGPVYAEGSTWGQWLVDDQRSFSSRPDVLTYTSELLKKPVALGGQPIANLFASTSGTDCDFVVKLIDVYPDEYPAQPELAGYRLMISADILRGRYRNDVTHPSPIPSGNVERFRWALPAANHVFLTGHRIMVQIQSSWFPLYDRNPQTFVESIFWAKPEDFRKAVQRIYQTGEKASSIELPVVQ
jgi:uncharacterized protein